MVIRVLRVSRVKSSQPCGRRSSARRSRPPGIDRPPGRYLRATPNRSGNESFLNQRLINMHRLHHLVVLAVAGASATFFFPVPSRAQANTCPGTSVQQEARVRNFLAAEHTAPVRQQLGLAAVLPGDVRHLHDEADRETCARLWDALRAGDAESSPPGDTTFSETCGRLLTALWAMDERNRGPADTTVAGPCDRLRVAVEAQGGQHPQLDSTAFFEAGGFYFVTILRPTPQTASSAAIDEASSQIYVIDRGFRFVVRLLA
jgi:hypothetical protein